ncbi:PUA-like domain-containing protein, partial [Amylocystis lapponica]
QQVSDAAVHPGILHGICGNKTDGAYSVVLSKFYENEDHGDRFIYTGAGGHDSKVRSQRSSACITSPTIDQSFEHMGNSALKVSSITKKPVRVVRGANVKSPYAPAEGYRYDGLYIVERVSPTVDVRDGLGDSTTSLGMA